MNDLLSTENELSDLLESTFIEIKGLYKKPKTSKPLLAKLKKIKDLLKIDNETQAIAMTMAYNFRLKEEDLTNKKIAQYLDCNISDISGLMNDFNILFFKGLLVKIETHTLRCVEIEKTIFYNIIYNDLSSYYKSLEIKGIYEFFNNIDRIINSLLTISKDSSVVKKEEYYAAYMSHFRNCVAVNAKEPLIKKLEVLVYPNEYAKLILYYLNYLIVFQNMDAFNIGNLINTGFQIGQINTDLKVFFTNKNGTLFKHGYVESLKGDYDTGNIKFTKKYFDIFINNDKTLIEYMPETSLENGDVIKPEEIKSKQIFYNKNEEEVTNTLISAFKDSNLEKLSKRLSDAGFSSGMTVLFHGHPGTGKTETAMQIAKMTNRPIMQVDFSQIKDMYVGNSEKNMKAIFTSYYEYIDKKQEVPILLFNEADSLISKRLTRISHSTDQMSNTMQNILLQEMENFKGILIATTNLIDNIDGAFDRRFLYKLKFEKPSLENKIKIWQDKNKWLKINDANKLAETYDFSGGQIENVTKKYLIDSALKGIKPSFLILDKYCKDEEFRNSDQNNSSFKGFKS